MLSQDTIPATAIAAFLDTARQYFRPATATPPLRPILRALMLIGSVGGALGQPAWATPLPGERNVTIAGECGEKAPFAVLTASSTPLD